MLRLNLTGLRIVTMKCFSKGGNSSLGLGVHVTKGNDGGLSNPLILVPSVREQIH